MIDGLVKYNPVQGIKVHGKKNKDYSEEFSVYDRGRVS